MKKLLIILCIALYGVNSYSQVEVADKYFRDYAYYEAIELYKEALKKKDSSEHILSRLGDCYYNNSNSEKAALWYGKAVNKYDKINPEYIFKYIQTLRSLGNYEEANKWLTKFKEIQKNDKRAKGYELASIDKFKELSSTENVLVNVANLNSNTKYSDFGGFQQGEKLYFSSSRTKDSILDKKKLYQWNEEPFLKIYEASVSYDEGNIEINDVSPIPAEKMNYDYIHEGTLAITSDGNTMYFTRNNSSKKGKKSYDKGGTSNLKLFRAKLNNGQWTNVEELPFNDKTFSTGHPTLSPDEKTLYFVSDREGGFGQSDLYKIAINADGTFGTVKNLGGKINTEGREMFPFVAQDSTLYFSSDAHINLGLLDIFKTDILKKAKNDSITIKNMGAPYNSGDDDFAFFLNTDGKSGYFSSNRPKGKGGDDIYAFGKYECKQTVTGITYNKLNNEPLADVSVKLMDETGRVVETIFSNENGEYLFENLDCDKNYSILGTKVIHRPDSKEFSTTDVDGGETQIDLYLTPLIQNNEIVINPIFFDYDKSNIRPDAAYELENIVTVMREHPKMIIKIESHTDSRGRDAYNLKLSDRRAKSTRDYIISRGIEYSRIESATGYGESQLVNRCTNEMRKICSEEEHQQNRRSKFIITNDYLN